MLYVSFFLWDISKIASILGAEKKDGCQGPREKGMVSNGPGFCSARRSRAPCLVGSLDHQFPRLLGSRGSSKPWGQGVSAQATQQDPVSKYYKVKRAAEMIQWLRALIAHGEEPGPFPSTYSHVGSQPSIASSRESHALS